MGFVANLAALLALLASPVYAALRWGVVGPGRISHEFTVSLKLTNSTLQAVAAGSAPNKLERARAFAETFGFPKYYDSYLAAARDPDIDIVYIGTTNNLHYPNAKMFLKHGKHVLLEKPTAMNYREHRDLVKIAESRNLFFSTNYWTRFFPAFKYARQVAESGEIGDIQMVTGDMAFQAVNNPLDRFMNKTMGGGAIKDMGCYQVQFSTLFAAKAGEMGEPDFINGVGTLTADGVDISSSWSFTWNRFNEGIPPVMAHFTTSMARPSRFETEIIGSNGRVIIRAPTNCPEDIDVEVFSPAKVTPTPCCGQPRVDARHFNNPLMTYPREYLPMRYPQGAGFVYIIQAIEQGIAQGLMSLPEITTKEQLLISKLTDVLQEKVAHSSKILGPHYAMPVPEVYFDKYASPDAQPKPPVYRAEAAYVPSSVPGFFRLLSVFTWLACGVLLGLLLSGLLRKRRQTRFRSIPGEAWLASGKEEAAHITKGTSSKLQSATYQT
eukprot:gb/GEZN01005366.1/.p1 GENE.gb/GEZN01005366.1/~~gb/GEZN01005366.1/.p1  ORF type:complete len:495 (+),score=69.89 gb/GEZN01005366.1/:86-1570(+)